MTYPTHLPCSVCGELIEIEPKYRSRSKTATHPECLTKTTPKAMNEKWMLPLAIVFLGVTQLPMTFQANKFNRCVNNAHEVTYEVNGKGDYRLAKAVSFCNGG